MLYINWCARSTIALSCGFFTVFRICLISKSFSKGLNSCLKSDPLSNTTLIGIGYILSHVLLNNWLALSEDLSMYSLFVPIALSMSNVGTLLISNQAMAGSIISVQVILTPFLMVVPPIWCCRIDFLYVPIRYICTISHVFGSAVFLGGRLPQRVFIFLNY